MIKDLNSKFNASKKLLERLHKVIGKTQIPAICNKIPERTLLYKTSPIKSPTARYNITNIMLMKIEICKVVLMLFSISV